MLHLTIQIILAQAFMEKPGNQINIRNKKASFEYQFLEYDALAVARSNFLFRPKTFDY